MQSSAGTVCGLLVLVKFSGPIQGQAGDTLLPANTKDGKRWPVLYVGRGGRPICVTCTFTPVSFIYTYLTDGDIKEKWTNDVVV